MSLLDDILDPIFECVEEHPLLVILLVMVLFFGGCSIAVHIHLVSSATKLMPY